MICRIDPTIRTFSRSFISRDVNCYLRMRLLLAAKILQLLSRGMLHRIPHVASSFGKVLFA